MCMSNPWTYAVYVDICKDVLYVVREEKIRTIVFRVMFGLCTSSTPASAL